MLHEKTLHNNFHPLLHPDIFAIIALYLGKHIGAVEFCEWLCTCKRAVRLSERVDVYACESLLRFAYAHLGLIKIAYQRILPYDLIRRTIKISPRELFDIPIHMRTYELCKIAVCNIPSIAMRLRYETKLTDDEQFALWHCVITKHPSYIQEAELRWEGARMQSLAEIAIQSDSYMACDNMSPFVSKVVKRWWLNRTDRLRKKQFWRSVGYCIAGGMVVCTIGLCTYHEPVTVILASLIATIGTIALQTLTRDSYVHIINDFCNH